MFRSLLLKAIHKKECALSFFSSRAEIFYHRKYFKFTKSEMKHEFISYITYKGFESRFQNFKHFLEICLALTVKRNFFNLQKFCINTYAVY